MDPSETQQPQWRNLITYVGHLVEMQSHALVIGLNYSSRIITVDWGQQTKNQIWTFAWFYK